MPNAKKKRSHSGQWKPGESGNPRGRPKKKNILTESLTEAAQSTFEYWDGPTKRRKKKSDFITELILDALTTGYFVFPPNEPEGRETRVAISSSDLMKLIQFYFSRLEGTPKRFEEDKEDDSKKGVTPQELEQIKEQRWKDAREQIKELLEALEEDNDAEPEALE